MEIQPNFSILKTTLFMALLIVLSGCGGTANVSPETISPSATIMPQPSATFDPSPTTTAIPTSKPSITPTIPATSTPGPAWQSFYPLQEPVGFLNTDISNEEFQDLIIFNGAGNGGPFANIYISDPGPRSLYAFSPDGKRAGSLSPDYYESLLYFPLDASKKPMLVENGIALNHPTFQSITLPPECDLSAETSEKFEACSNFQFSPDGKYFGFLYGPTTCRRAIMIMDIKSGEVVYQFPEPYGHSFVLLENKKALIATGHCEGGTLAIWDLISGTGRGLGPTGFISWNVDRTAFVVDANEYTDGNRIWAFNLESNQLFIPPTDDIQIDDHPVWTPDKRYLIYQHRTLSRLSSTSFDKSRRIMLVDAQTGYQKVLLSDSAYDYHLGSDLYRAEWYGDWIRVRRIAFTPSPYSDDIRACYFYGSGCPSPVENFALNWKTGDLVPWDQMVQKGIVPGLEQTPRPGPDPFKEPMSAFLKGRLYPGPDEDTFWLYVPEAPSVVTAPNLESSPVYSHPNGLYAYYVGIDGGTLWMVPKEGDPILWVINGENFLYLPPVSEDD